MRAAGAPSRGEPMRPHLFVAFAGLLALNPDGVEIPDART
jgi:hypothetical protein